jgi:hypothetical protein
MLQSKRRMPALFNTTTRLRSSTWRSSFRRAAPATFSKQRLLRCGPLPVDPTQLVAVIASLVGRRALAPRSS